MNARDNNGWKKVNDTNVVLKTPVFDIEKTRMKCLRTGKEGDFYVLKCFDWVNIIAVTSDNQLVMIKQYRVGSKQIELEIPGGGMESHETDPIVAGARELLEETGYAGKNGKIIGKVCPNPAIQGNTCYTVYFTDAERVSEPNMDSMEDIETLLVPVDQIHNKIINGKITHGLVLNALYFMEKIL